MSPELLAILAVLTTLFAAPFVLATHVAARNAGRRLLVAWVGLVTLMLAGALLLGAAALVLLPT